MAPRLTKPAVPSLRQIREGGMEVNEVGDIIDAVSAATAEYVDKKLGEFKKHLSSTLENVRTEENTNVGVTFQKSLDANVQRLEGTTNKALAEFENKALSAVYGVLDRELPARIEPLTRLKVEEEIVRRKKALMDSMGRSAEELDKLLNNANGVVGGMVDTALEKTFNERLGMLFKSFDSELTKAKTQEITERVKSLDGYQSELKSLQEGYKALQNSYVEESVKQRKDTDTLLKKQAEEYAANLANMKASCDTAISGMKSYCETRIEDMKKCYEGILNDLKGVVSSLPPPHVDVHVPSQEPPNIHIPADSIKVAIEQAKADVHITVPEQPPAQIMVHHAPTKKTKKTITYDDFGRPTTIIEEENEVKNGK